MDKDKKWMLITYYCPTHGDLGIVNPISITKKDLFYDCFIGAPNKDF